MSARAGSIVRVARIGKLLLGAGFDRMSIGKFAVVQAATEGLAGIDMGDGFVVWCDENDLDTPTTAEVAAEIFSRRDEVAALKAQIETLKAQKSDGPLGAGTLFRLEVRREAGGMLDSEFMTPDGKRLSLSAYSPIYTRGDGLWLAGMLLRTAGMLGEVESGRRS